MSGPPQAAESGILEPNRRVDVPNSSPAVEDFQSLQFWLATGGYVHPNRLRLLSRRVSPAMGTFPVGMHAPFRLGGPTWRDGPTDAADGPICRPLVAAEVAAGPVA